MRNRRAVLEAISQTFNFSKNTLDCRRIHRPSLRRGRSVSLKQILSCQVEVFCSLRGLLSNEMAHESSFRDALARKNSLESVEGESLRRQR